MHGGSFHGKESLRVHRKAVPFDIFHLEPEQLAWLLDGYDVWRMNRKSPPVKTALPVPSIIPKGPATPELLAAITVAKYIDGLPLYRMEEIFKRHDNDLGRTTMVRSKPYSPKKIVLFEYSTSRGSETMTDLISGFEGYLQFEKAKTEGAKSGKSLGEEGLKFYNGLYASPRSS